MPYTVGFDEASLIVTVTVWGRASHADHCAARAEALRVCRERNCSRVLVDLRELDTARSSTFDCFDFGASLPEALPRVHLAHVLPAERDSREDVRFTVTVGANRGSFTQEFDSVDEARKWLLRWA